MKTRLILFCSALLFLLIGLLQDDAIAAFGCGIGVGAKESGTINEYNEGVFRPRFEAAYNQFSSELGGCATSYVHWWEGLLVQDLNSQGGQHYAIFYDVNIHQGGGEAYTLWGPILARYWDNSSWGPPTSNRTEAWASEAGTTGHLVRYNDLDVYYNDSRANSYVIRGVTRDRYNALGGTASFLGFPNEEGLPAIASGHSGAEGFYQPFEGGIMHTFPHAGVWKAFEVHGAIQATFNSLPGQGSGSQLGFPITGEIDTNSSPSGRNGKVQIFEGGRVYYDSTGSDGATYVLFNNVANQLSSNYAASTTDIRLGFPISSQRNRDDCFAFFEFGYIDCFGIQVYGTNQPPAPTLSLPYRTEDAVEWTAGPHAHFARFDMFEKYDAGMGSALDFAMGNVAFDVFAMASGTVVEIEDDASKCNASLSLGCRVAIRSDDGGSVLIYSHLEPNSLKVVRHDIESGEDKERVMCNSSEQCLNLQKRSLKLVV